MDGVSRQALAAAIAVIGIFAGLNSAFAAEEATATPSAAEQIRVEDPIYVVAQRANRTSRGATVLPLSLIETPQSVTIIDRDFIDDFGLNDVNHVLDLTTGVNVEEVESDRTYYNSRGFDIKSMQTDGVGMPFNWNIVGALDTVLYDKIEVIRGANGLLTGTGNPSGTINYIRKRPTNDFNASAELSAGSWNKVRAEFDISGPLTESGSWAGRAVAAVQSSDSYLNLYSNDRTVFYGVIDGAIGNNATLTLGYAQQDNRSSGVFWGALPMLYSDGAQAEFDVSTTTTMSWTFWDTHTKTGFAELNYKLPGEWLVKGYLTYTDYHEPSNLFYTYASPSYDRDTGLGLYGYPGAYTADTDQLLFDGTASGPIYLFGRRHEFLLGFNISHSDSEYLQADAPFTDPAWGALPSFPGWTGLEIARPAFGDYYKQGDWSDDMKRLYGVAKINVTDELNIIAGFNAIDVKSDGYNFGESMERDEQAVSPYAGLTYNLTDNIVAYGSYSDIYEPQGEFDVNYKLLGAAVGKSYEAGPKAEWFGGRLFTSAAWFKASQDNYAEWGGYHLDGVSYYVGTDLRSHGFELEAAGRVTDDWSVQAGFTHLTLEDPSGAEARTFIPRSTFNLGTKYIVSAIPGLELGGTLKWQGDIYLDNGLGIICQDAFLVGSVFASYRVSNRVEFAINVDNIGDEKYLSSLYWDQAFYAEPRNFTGVLRLTY